MEAAAPFAPYRTDAKPRSVWPEGCTHLDPAPAAMQAAAAAVVAGREAPKPLAAYSVNTLYEGLPLCAHYDVSEDEDFGSHAEVKAITLQGSQIDLTVGLDITLTRAMDELASDDWRSERRHLETVADESRGEAMAEARGLA